MRICIAYTVLHRNDHLLNGWLGLGVRIWCVARLIVLADNLVATVIDAQVDVVVDGEVKVTAFPLYTAIVIIGDEVHVQTGSAFTKVEVDILIAVDDLGASGSHAGPTAKQVGGIAKAVAPSIES